MWVSFMLPTELFLCQWSPGLAACFIPTSIMRLWDGAHNLGPSWKERKEGFLLSAFLLVIPLHCAQPNWALCNFFSVQMCQREVFLTKGSPFLVTEPASLAWEACCPLSEGSWAIWDPSVPLGHPAAQCHTDLAASHHHQRLGAVQLKIQVTLLAPHKGITRCALKFSFEVVLVGFNLFC